MSIVDGSTRPSHDACELVLVVVGHEGQSRAGHGGVLVLALEAYVFDDE